MTSSTSSFAPTSTYSTPYYQQQVYPNVNVPSNLTHMGGMNNMSGLNSMYPYYNYNYGGNWMYGTGQVNPYYYQYPTVGVTGIVGSSGLSPINTINTITTVPTSQDPNLGLINTNNTPTPQTQVSNMTPEEYQIYMQQYQQMLMDPNYYSKLYSSYGITGVGKIYK